MVAFDKTTCSICGKKYIYRRWLAKHRKRFGHYTEYERVILRKWREHYRKIVELQNWWLTLPSRAPVRCGGLYQYIRGCS